MNIVVTTALRPSSQMLTWARDIALYMNAPYVPRQKRSMAAIQVATGATALVVVMAHGPVVYSQGEKLFFHVNMAQLRIKNLKSGKIDHMVDCCGLQCGQTLLDCTLGLAADATVASFVVGPTGRVVGLESSRILAMLAAFGVRHYQVEDIATEQALRRLIVVPVSYQEYLPALPENSFDVVYFDPMFRRPKLKTASFRPLRLFADHHPLSTQAIIEACRVARRRVVVKEAAGSAEFARLGISELYGGKYSSIKYGVINVGEQS